MAHGPGKYDAVTTALRERVEGGCVAVVVIDGNEGSGFSVQTTNPEYYRLLVDFLRTAAATIEKDAGN